MQIGAIIDNVELFPGDAQTPITIPSCKILTIEGIGSDSRFTNSFRSVLNIGNGARTNEFARRDACMFGKETALMFVKDARCARRLFLVELIVDHKNSNSDGLLRKMGRFPESSKELEE